MTKSLRKTLTLPANLLALLIGKSCRRWIVLEAYRASHGFRSAGQRVSIGVNCVFEPGSNITVGDDVYIGPGCYFLTTNAKIRIGNGVMFGPQVGIVTGNHNISASGIRMIDVKEKRPKDDRDVVIEDNVWIGFRAIILKGVTVRTGAVVGAGAVVTRDVPSNSVVGGVPAHVLFMR